MILTVIVRERKEGESPFPPPGIGFIYHSDEEGVDRLMIRCPRCGQAAICPHDFVVDDEGQPTLNPSFGCQQCGFHSYLRNGRHEQLEDFK